MVTPLFIFSDESSWLKLKGLVLQENSYSKSDLRTMAEGMLYRVGVGGARRDLLDGFGRWNLGYKKFNQWSE